MDNLHDDMDRMAIEEILEEEFQPELFYKALTNALEQLDQYAVEAA